MVIGVLQFELLIHDAQSLKDKRRVVASLKDRLHRDLRVSIAEVGLQDRPSAARMAVALVARDGARAGEVLDKVVLALRRLADAELGDMTREILHDPRPVDSADADDSAPDPRTDHSLDSEMRTRAEAEDAA
ncbi:MAG: DUF503 domain-containing protein [Phycisphaerales bacterium]|nr:DUF503 domain-containing protein [Phycisphaerales bacterium]